MSPYARLLLRLAGLAWIAVVLYAYALQIGRPPAGVIGRLLTSLLRSLTAEYLK